jgi:hypothetical protein
VAVVILETQQQVDEYLNEWKSNISQFIAGKKPDRSIKDYPTVNEAFEKMKLAWNASFKDQRNIGKILARDEAILELGKTIGKDLK